MTSTMAKTLLRFLIAGVAVLITTLVFSAILATTAFERLHEQAVIARITAAASLLRHELKVPGRLSDVWNSQQTADVLRSGWVRFNVALANEKSLLSPIAIKALSLAEADGTIRHSTEYSAMGTRLPDKAFRKSLDRLGQSLGLEEVRYTRVSDGYQVMLPLGEASREGSVYGWLAVDVESSLVKGDAHKRIRSVYRITLHGLVMGVAMLFGLAIWWVIRQQKRKRSLIWGLIITVTVAHAMAFIGYAFALQIGYMERLEERSELGVRLLVNELQSHLKRGGRLDDEEMTATIDRYRSRFWLEDLAVSYAHDAAFKTVLKGAGIESTLSVEVPLFVEKHLTGRVIATPSAKDAYLQLRALLMEGLTTVTLTLLLCVEFIGFAALWLNFQVTSSFTDAASGERHKAMRPAIFLFLFGIDISMSILPLQAERLYEPLFGLSRDMVMGLPISVEFLCVGIALLVSGLWIDRCGWRKPFICGLILALVGGLYSWFAPDVLQFVISRAIVGLGYGLTLLAAQGYVITYTDVHSKARGLAYLFAGLYAGSICGAATGATLAERLGYDKVFLIGTFILAGALVYVCLCLRDEPDIAKPMTGQAETKTAGTGAFARFLRDGRFLVIVFLSSLPAAIAVVGFLNYFSPIYLDRMGAAESTTGQVLMLFGLSLTLLGPSIGRYVDAARTRTMPIFIGSLLAALAFLSFAVLEGVPATTFAVVLLGLSNSFVLPAQSAYVLELDVARSLGQGKVIGFFRATSRVGQFLGPILFASLITATSLRQGIVYFGLVYLAIAALFFVLMCSPKSDFQKTYPRIKSTASDEKQKYKKQILPG